MNSSRIILVIVVLLIVCHSIAFAQLTCKPAPTPPQLPVVRASGRFSTTKLPLRVMQRAGIADSWKPTRREIASIPAGTMVDVLEDVIVVDAPDVVWVTKPNEELKVKEGDTILRYAHLEEGWADLWVQGCWYKDADAGFITDPDGGGCEGANCAAKVTKVGRQTWWFRVRLPNGKSGWTQSQNLDLSAGG
jgi:hypothetical protein